MNACTMSCMSCPGGCKQAASASMAFVCLFCSKPEPHSKQHMPSIHVMQAWILQGSQPVFKAAGPIQSFISVCFCNRTALALIFQQSSQLCLLLLEIPNSLSAPNRSCNTCNKIKPQGLASGLRPVAATTKGKDTLSLIHQAHLLPGPAARAARPLHPGPALTEL